MNINYFSKTRILDGGMSQQLLSKGLKAKGSLPTHNDTYLLDQRAKNKFCYKFARQSNSPLKDLKRALSDGK